MQPQPVLRFGQDPTHWDNPKVETPGVVKVASSPPDRGGGPRAGCGLGELGPWGLLGGQRDGEGAFVAGQGPLAGLEGGLGDGDDVGATDAVVVG